MTAEHSDIRNLPRKGWFTKVKDDGKPAHKNYRTTCKQGGKGYLGPLHEAHHILPQTSIFGSVEAASAAAGAEAAERRQFLADVMWVTDWNINNPGNMMGLPHYHSYDLYYQQLARLQSAQGDAPKSKELVSWFNTAYREEWAKKWLTKLTPEQVGKPEGWPIHNPVNWGHTEYNKIVQDALERRVWRSVAEQRAKHEFDAPSVKSGLEALSSRWFSELQKRGADARRENWDRRHDPDDDDWHTPFTMADVPNPLF